jgi:hypothetical protein
MKKLIILFYCLLAFEALAFSDPKVGGVVIVDSGFEKKLTPKGKLLVVAKKPGADHNEQPLAVIKINNPKFPQAFVITPKNVLVPGTPFTGPVIVTAIYFPSGDGMNIVGAFEGADPKNISTELGNNNLSIILNSPVNIK